MTDSNHELLIELLLADELSDEQQEQLRALTCENEAVADAVFDQMWLEPLLHDSFNANPDAFAARMELALDRDDIDSSRFTQRVLDAWTVRSARRSRLRVASTLATFSVVAILVAIAFGPPWFDRSAQAAPRLLHMSGSVQVVDSKGISQPVVLGMLIEPGDSISTSGSSSATVVWNDGSQITLTRDASAQWNVDKTQTVQLDHGLAIVACERLAAQPIVFVTRHATIEAPDTLGLLATTTRRTDVTVRRGSAQIMNRAGETIQIATGKSAVANTRSIVQHHGPATPDTWSEDFENGLPTGWQGTFVETGLPRGSQGAAQTTATTNDDGETCHQLWSYSDWEHGLAVVHADTCLRFIYRFKTADTVQLMALMRPPYPETAAYEVQVLPPSDLPVEEQWWNVQPDRWYSVSIPLSRLRNPVNLSRPAESLIVIAFNFRAQNHACRLAIDHMWLERGTSQRIEFKPIHKLSVKQG